VRPALEKLDYQLRKSFADNVRPSDCMTSKSEHENERDKVRDEILENYNDSVKRRVNNKDR